MVNDTLTFGHSRWVDDDCRKATIKADGWLLMVGDTMQFLKHDCDPEYTAFKTTRTIQYEKTIIDITTTYWYQLQQYMVAAIEKYGWKWPYKRQIICHEILHSDQRAYCVDILVLILLHNSINENRHKIGGVFVWN